MEGGAQTWLGTDWKLDPNASWRDARLRQEDTHPVVCVSWKDANAYAEWLSDQSTKNYRLLTEAECEYVTRAGCIAPFWWGASISPVQANYDARFPYAFGGSKGKRRKATVPVNCYEANPWGLFNVHGNVWQWCEDVWHENYYGAPVDGSPWLNGGDSSLRVVRGGSWGNSPRRLRSASRGGFIASARYNAIGFRLARTLSH